MKTKKFRLMAVLAALLLTLNLQAQVTIGSLTEPAKGAILDLNSTTKGGLLFPNVEITSLNAIPAGFTNQPSGGGGQIEALEGMVIYHPNKLNSDFPAGLYVWTGTQWFSLSDLAKIAELRDEIKLLIGELSALTTDDKTTVVDGINEVNGKVGDLTLLAAELDTPSSAVEAINALNGIVGDKAFLANELTKTSVVTGINSVNAKIGIPTTDLTTDAKTTVVAGINEVNGKVGDLNTKVGDLSTIASLSPASVVDGIYKLNDKIGNFSTIVGLPNGSVAADLSTLNDRVGNLGSLSAGTVNSSLVTAINSVKGYAETLSQAQEVPRSPYLGYTAFKADAGDSTYTLPKFAYVTFANPIGSEITPIPAGGRWNEVTGGDTWRLDYSSTDNKWSLTSSLTVASRATLAPGSSMSPPPNTAETGDNYTVSEWLKMFHDNLIALLGKFSGGVVTVAAGGTGVDASSSTANTVFAAPSGSAGMPSFRKLVLADLPTTSTANSFLKVGASSTAPAYSTILASDIPALDAAKITTGVLPVANGGTAAATAGQNTVFAGSATAAGAAPSFRKLALTDLPPSATAKRYLRVGTADGTPTYSAVDAGDITSGTLAIARGGTGKSADAVPNTVFAGPGTGSANGSPAFRTLVTTDLPTVTVAKGGTGATNATDARTNLGAQATLSDAQLNAANSGITGSNRPVVTVKKGKYKSSGSFVWESDVTEVITTVNGKSMRQYYINGVAPNSGAGSTGAGQGSTTISWSTVDTPTSGFSFEMVNGNGGTPSNVHFWNSGANYMIVGGGVALSNYRAGSFSFVEFDTGF